MTDDVLLPCERERKLLDALRLDRDPEHPRWTHSRHAALIDDMPDHVREAVAGAYPMPVTAGEAYAELSYWHKREVEMEEVLGERFKGQALDISCELRRKVILELELKPKPAAVPAPAGKRARAEQALRADPAASDREISRATGPSPTTIGKLRKALGLPAAQRRVTRGGTTFPMDITRRAGEDAGESRAEHCESAEPAGA